MKKYIYLLVTFVVISTSANAQKSPVFVLDGYAINGYDAVAYFKSSKPVKGNTHYKLNWQEATWLFATQENLEAFKNDPQKFAPQYGGYCAYGCSNGYKAATQPDAWTIVDNKLYLNYNTDVRSSWQKNQDALIKKADDNWPEIRNK